MNVTRPRALVTNDDGIDSEGLRELALVADDAGLNPVVAAPAMEASGSSAAMAAAQAEGRIVVKRRELVGLDQVPAHAVDASPAFIVFTGAAQVRRARVPPPAQGRRRRVRRTGGGGRAVPGWAGTAAGQ
jgi:broad specificity polyphosphatase/5'/3'-nucleotidase SurE